MTKGYHPFNPLAAATGRGRHDSRKILVEAMTDEFTVPELPDVVNRRTKYRVVNAALDADCIEVKPTPERAVTYRMTDHGKNARMEGIYTVWNVLVTIMVQNGMDESQARRRAAGRVGEAWDIDPDLVPREPTVMDTMFRSEFARVKNLLDAIQ